MISIKKFEKNITCVCKNNVNFEIIPDIECNWGIHDVIQCPKCEELFSIDVECPAFQTLQLLDSKNKNLFSNDEIKYYLKNAHLKNL